MDTFDMRGFQDVDRSGNVNAYVAYLDAAGGGANFRKLKQYTYDLLAPAPGSRLLDAGCGTGDDVRAMAALVTPGGEVVGIDASNAMIAEAQRRSLGMDLPVTFTVADMTAIPFADAEFDGCRAERVFMHMREPKRGLTELLRVLRPGGRIAVFEPDFVSILVDAEDTAVTRAVSDARREMTACADIGRRLLALFRDCGLTDVLIEPRSSVLLDYASANLPARFAESVDFAVSQGSITAEQGAAWLADLRERDREGRFFMATIAFVASATKPG